VTFNPFDWGYQIWRIVFVIAAGWTALLALPGLFTPGAGLRFYWGNYTNRLMPKLGQWLISFGLLALAAGLALTAKDPASWLWLVAVAVVAKISHSLSLLYFHLHEKNSDMVALMALLDGVQCAFFITYLIGGARSF
jgi:hypothetical protein